MAGDKVKKRCGTCLSYARCYARVKRSQDGFNCELMPACIKWVANDKRDGADK